MQAVYINKIKKYIEEHFTEDISLDDIAGITGYSKYHLNRIFLESTGQTIHKYVRERRLYEAARLLADSDQAIVEIALNVGYAFQQSFTQAFKQKFQCTPQTFRQRNIICPHTEYIPDYTCSNIKYKNTVSFLYKTIAA